MKTPFDLVDELGPAKILHLSNPSVGLKAIVVVDNVACGPAIGGTRMAADVSLEECARLARAMTFKNAAAGLAHGGAKSVIFADPAMEPGQKETLMRAFACGIEHVHDYIPGPDMGTNEVSMAWVQDEIGRSVGLPREIGGIPLDEIGATGLGVAVAAEVAQEFCDVSLQGARIAVQGFGAVGQHAARQLVARGAVLVAAADSQNTITDKSGLDFEAVAKTKRQYGRLSAHSGVEVHGSAYIAGVDCDILIPAARPDVLTDKNADSVQAKLVLQGANIPATAAAEDILHQRGVLSVPDFIANAGGVICAAVEFHGGSETAALAEIEDKIRRNTREVLERARSEGVKPRTSALALARDRLQTAMQLRRWR